MRLSRLRFRLTHHMTSVTTTPPVAAAPAEPRGPGLPRRMLNRFEGSFLYLGGITDLAVQTVQQAVRGPIDRDIVMTQFDQIGVRSMSIVAITSLFIGMVLALQSAYSLADFGGSLFIGKTIFFGFAIGLIGCYNGLKTSGGADGVGRSTTATVVTASITVLIMDFFLTKLFLLIF